MTGRWFQPYEVAELLGVDVGEVRALIAARKLRLELVHTDHYAISEQDVNAVLAERARRPVPRDPDNPAEAEMTPADEDDYDRERRT